MRRTHPRVSRWDRQDPAPSTTRGPTLHVSEASIAHQLLRGALASPTILRGLGLYPLPSANTTTRETTIATASRTALGDAGCTSAGGGALCMPVCVPVRDV